MSGGIWRWGPKQRRGGVTGRLLDAFWQVTMSWSITVEGTVTWWTADDKHQRERKIDWELGVPRVLWRPYCRWMGHHDEYYGECVFCQAPLPASVYAPSVTPSRGRRDRRSL